jgi:hypothetical protein
MATFGGRIKCNLSHSQKLARKLEKYDLLMEKRVKSLMS